MHGTFLAQRPHGGVFFLCSPNPFLLFALKIPPSITCSHRDVLTARTSGYYRPHVLSQYASLTNLHSDREWRKTQKPQVGEGWTTCITHVLRFQLKSKVEYNIRCELNKKTFALQIDEENTEVFPLLNQTNTHVPWFPCWKSRAT